MDSWDFAGRLAQLKQQDLYRSRQIINGPQGVEVHLDGVCYNNFSSNDYLGLANHPLAIKAFKAASEKYGVGSGSAHLICGHSAEHHALEEELASFTGRDRALVFSTGYMANIGAISALVGQQDAVFEDKLNHASLIDGGLISGARFRRYPHANVNRLAELLQQSAADKKLIVTDGVFSMDGDEAPLRGLIEQAKKTQSMLMVDDAHGIGVLGHTGGGLLQQQGVSQEQVPVLMGTFGKALGSFGAFIAGSEELIETLIQLARPYIYTTAPPAAVMAATRANLKLCIEDGWRREKLVALVEQFRTGAKQISLQLLESSTPIQAVVLGDNELTMAASGALKKKGFLVGAIRSPTVPQGSERLRITFSASHSSTQVDELLSALSEVV
ncbi:MAG: 8-amino-7-oxononanoate synthase [Cycloclasticus sp. symbiont of Poecilosclerida sp. M]|nr:MAG: 8-amino-7-oxononanoate synthase [Cycloclasticus sp. symbiont of Poecilosclerida sp. M]